MNISDSREVKKQPMREKVPSEANVPPAGHVSMVMPMWRQRVLWICLVTWFVMSMAFAG